MEKEIYYANIEGYEGCYIITPKGEIYSVPRKGTSGQLKLKKTVVTKNGYEQVQLCKDGITRTYYVHILMAKAFLTKPSENNWDIFVVNHIDGNPLNNKIENLEYCTQSENIMKALQGKKKC